MDDDRSMTTTKRTVDAGRHQLFAPKDANDNVPNNIEVNVVGDAEKFYTELHSHQGGQECGGEENVSLDLKVPNATVDEAGEDGLAIRLITDAGDSILNKHIHKILAGLERSKILEKMQQSL